VCIRPSRIRARALCGFAVKLYGVEVCGRRKAKFLGMIRLAYDALGNNYAFRFMLSLFFYVHLGNLAHRDRLFAGMPSVRCAFCISALSLSASIARA
jgi:hypothetical protein